MEKLHLPWNSVGNLLEDAARKHADRPLFIFEDEKLSYREVDTRVNRIANALRELDVKKGDAVSVMLHNGFDFPLIWLAIAKAGAVMVPVNINYQAHDLEYILNDSSASLMIIHHNFLSRFEAIRGRVPGIRDVLVLGDGNSLYKSFEQQVDRAADSFTIDDVGDEDLLNIQYTSGTTGFPKGCMLTHRYWMVTAYHIRDMVQLDHTDVDLTAQSFYYLDGQWNVLMCMIAGAAIVIMPKFSVSKFWPTVIKNNVTFFYVLSTMPNYLLSREPDALERNHKVKRVLCSAIVPALHETFEQRFSCPWREVFGMTETGTDIFVPFDDRDCVGSGAIGAPVSTKEARIIDSTDNQLPDGEAGELIIRGEPMMSGYWQKPEATEEVFRGGWLHTGDLAFRDEKGYFHLVGRVKDMVRRNAENISSAEVEGVLVQHPKIKVAAIVPVPDLIHGEEVKAYVILNDNEDKDSLPPQEIIAFAQSRLARFKVPRYIEYVTDLPRTPSERVEKHKLIKAKDDLRLDSYDAEREIWITGDNLEG